MENSGVAEAVRTMESINPSPNPTQFVKSANLFKYVLRMKHKIAEEHIDYVELCLSYILADEKPVNNCVMFTDVENEIMDQPLWYFGLNQETLMPEPIDVDNIPDYQTYALIVISGGENVCIPGNWRDSIVYPRIDKKKLFAGVKKAKGYNPVFANVKALEASNCGRLTLFYTREVPLMFNMAEWNLAHGTYKDENGDLHISLARGQGLIVKFKELIDNPEKYAKYLVEGEDSLSEHDRFYMSTEVTSNSEYAKYRRLPGVVLRKTSKGKLFPTVELQSICEGEPSPYKEESSEMSEYCVLLETA